MGSTGSLGTVAWARARHGRLTAREQVREAATAAGVLLGTVPERLRRLLSLPNPTTVRAVLDRYPREHLKRDGIGLFEAESHPGTRTHLLNRRLMFGTLVRLAPFSE